MEDQIDEVASIDNNDCKYSGGRNTRLQRETDAAQLALKTPLWFRLLLKIPELPSTIYLPAIMGLLCYFLLPMIIILGYLLAFLYIVFTVPFPWIYACLAGIVLPLAIVSLSIKARAFWNYWQYVVVTRSLREVSLEQQIEDYVALVKGKENP